MKLRMKRLLILLWALMLLYALGCAGGQAQETATAPENPATTAPETATAAPETPADSAQAGGAGGAYDGITFTSSDLNGRKIDQTYIRDSKVTVVNFWATWCPPCVREIPDFSNVAAAYASKGCAFLGVQCDEDMEAAKQLWTENGVTYPTVLPDGGLADIASRLPGYPVTMLFDSDGKAIGQMHVGAMSETALTALIDDALKAQ